MKCGVCNQETDEPEVFVTDICAACVHEAVCLLERVRVQHEEHGQHDDLAADIIAFFDGEPEFENG